MTCDEVRMRPYMKLEHFGQMQNCSDRYFCSAQLTFPEDTRESAKDSIEHAEESAILSECVNDPRPKLKVFSTFSISI